MSRIESSEVDAFPRAVADTARAVLAALTPNQLFKPIGSFSVRVDDETLTIPYRVYYDMAKVRSVIEADGQQGVVALCLGSRHHDGFLRESCARRLLVRDESWVVPFIFQLLGEYVVEIIRPIEEAIAADRQKYAGFARDNPAYFLTTQRRAISYWDIYYRHLYPTMRDYPALKELESISPARHSRACGNP